MSDKIEKDEEVTSKSTLDIIKEMTSKIKDAIKEATKDIKSVEKDEDVDLVKEDSDKNITIELDVINLHNLSEIAFTEYISNIAKKYNLTAKVQEFNGPAGGNPLVQLTGTAQNLKTFNKEYYKMDEQEFVDDYIEFYYK